jgi:hypothetical protein
VANKIKILKRRISKSVQNLKFPKTTDNPFQEAGTPVNEYVPNFRLNIFLTIKYFN